MLKTNGITPLFAVTYCPLPLQTTEWEDTPNNLSSWQSIVQQYVSHYSSVLGVKGAYYEMWNEPDYGFFNGTVAQYGSIYRYGSAGVRARARIATPEVGGPAIAYDTTYLTGSGMLSQPMDFASIHAAYANSRQPTAKSGIQSGKQTGTAGAADGIRLLKQRLRHLLQQHLARRRAVF